MTSGKLAFWPTYPPLSWDKKIDNLVGNFDLPPLKNLRHFQKLLVFYIQEEE